MYESIKIVDFAQLIRYNVHKQIQIGGLSMKKNAKTIRIMSLLLLLSLTITLFAACGSGDRKRDAWVCALDVVEGRLKSPSTADFCSYPEATITDLGNNRYKIQGYVDAQNSFGATVRSKFTVTLTLTEKGYKEATCTIN